MMIETASKKSKVIVFLGPDGAGKSTILELVDAGLKHHGVTARKYYFAPGFLKRYRPSPVRTITTMPHAQPAYRSALVFMKILLMLVEFNLGIRKVRRESNFAIFDRFIHDLLIDPKRYRLGNVRWWMRALLTLAPKPDLAVIITAPTDVIQSRKQEVSPEETARQIVAYQKAAHLFSRVLFIDNNAPPAPLAAKIIKEIMSND